MAEDTTRSWKRPLVPNNPNGETDPDKINWNSEKVQNLPINWDRINFLVTSEREGNHYIHLHPKVPQIGGFGGVLAIQMNLVRFIEEHVEGGDKLIEKATVEALFDIAATLAAGGEIPLY